MDKRTYRLRSGAVIYDSVNQDAGKVLTNANCTDELAEYHLLTNKNCRKYFIDLREDIDDFLKSKYPSGIDDKPKVVRRKRVAKSETNEK